MLTIAGVAAVAGLWVGQMVDGHVHKAPHGGVVVHAGPYHLEVVVLDREIEVWVLDRAERPATLPGGATVAVALRAGDQSGPARQVCGAKRTVDASVPQLVFRQRAKARFTAPLVLGGAVGKGVWGCVQVRVGSKVHVAPFKWTLLDATHRINDGLKL